MREWKCEQPFNRTTRQNAVNNYPADSITRQKITSRKSFVCGHFDAQKSLYIMHLAICPNQKVSTDYSKNP
jgi:hypothetical protein